MTTNAATNVCVWTNSLFIPAIDFSITKNELKDYTYVDNVGTFSILVLKGSMKYINKYDLNLRSGGLVTKIYSKDNKWYAVIKKMNKNFYVSFDNNYIFYFIKML